MTGRQVTIFEAAERPLGKFDGYIIQKIVQSFFQEGIEIRTGVKIKKITKKAEGF